MGLATRSRENILEFILFSMMCFAYSIFYLCVCVCACVCFTFPEVARTRLREDSGRYHGFFRTLYTVGKEEGIRGLYRGMATHYIRQVPNSCIMIGTYEFVVFLLQSWDLTKITKN
ncbi:unnamed protein product [Trichobilharzia regenti]|nr:unnamed protein product [Trichobilharzia regenti]